MRLSAWLSLLGWLAVPVLIVLSTTQVENIDQMTVPLKPWVTNYPTPLPMPNFNPLALQRSLLGKMFSIALIDQSDRAFHVGMGKTRRVKATTQLGHWMEYLDHVAHWHPHVHANHAALANSQGGDHLVLTAAINQEETAVKWAYFFDPANYEAYDLVQHVLADDSSTTASKMVDLREPNGKLHHLSTAQARAVLFSYYAMTQFASDTPNGCLNRAAALENIWLYLQDRAYRTDRVAFWADTDRRMLEVGYWLKRAENLREVKFKQKQWQGESDLNIEAYERRWTLTYASWWETVSQYKKWRAKSAVPQTPSVSTRTPSGK